MNDQNLVIERRSPSGNYGAVLVYTDEALRGNTVYLLEVHTTGDGPFDLVMLPSYQANVVARTINGSRPLRRGFPVFNRLSSLSVRII
jgi:hypothetical protein